MTRDYLPSLRALPARLAKARQTNSPILHPPYPAGSIRRCAIGECSATRAGMEANRLCSRNLGSRIPYRYYVLPSHAREKDMRKAHCGCTVFPVPPCPSHSARTSPALSSFHPCLESLEVHYVKPPHRGAMSITGEGRKGKKQ